MFSRLVTFEWLKSSSRIGEWLRVNKFEPKGLLNSHPSLNIYRKSRQQKKLIELFNECGLIYLTSIAQQRQLLLKLITLLGGNVSLSIYSLIKYFNLLFFSRLQLVEIVQRLLLDNHQRHFR
jgi:hypothetical protein